jgi:hypothetical protein
MALSLDVSPSGTYRQRAQVRSKGFSALTFATCTPATKLTSLSASDGFGLSASAQPWSGSCRDYEMHQIVLGDLFAQIGRKQHGCFAVHVHQLLGHAGSLPRYTLFRNRGWAKV